jgi:MFS family permease
VSTASYIRDLVLIFTSDLLTLAGFMLILGQVLTMVSAKNVYLSSIIVFEIGSLICGVANSFPILLVGRAIAGCGGGG